MTSTRPELFGVPLTIASVAFPLARVGPDATGGAEQVLSQLDRALVSRGHRSIVIARDGSASQAKRCPPGARLLGPIPNGVPLQAFASMRKGTHAAALGRLCPEKGFHHAVLAARRAVTPDPATRSAG